jgi:hypothetical protein
MKFNERLQALYMKIFFLLILFLAFEALTPASFAQVQRIMVVKTYPMFTIQANVDYNQSYLELNGTYNNDFQSVEYLKGSVLGVDKGLGGSVTSKIALSERGRLRLNLSLSYNNFKTYLFGNKSFISDVGRSSVNIMSLGVGFEHNFTPNYKYKIYLGAEGTANMINGHSTIWVFVGGTSGYTYDVTIKNSFRIGAAIFGGTEYMISDKFGLSLGFKYHVANLLLKSAKASDDPYSFQLRDAEDPNIKYAGKKTLAFITIMAGANFYWGVETKRYTIK